MYINQSKKGAKSVMVPQLQERTGVINHAPPSTLLPFGTPFSETRMATAYSQTGLIVYESKDAVSTAWVDVWQNRDLRIDGLEARTQSVRDIERSRDRDTETET